MKIYMKYTNKTRGMLASIRTTDILLWVYTVGYLFSNSLVRRMRKYED